METLDIARLERELLEECAEDHLGLWAVIWPLREEFGIEDEDERRKITLRMLTHLLGMGLMRAGVPDGRLRFNAWNLPATEALKRIEREWNELGREPNIGDVVWFDITEKGRAYLARSEVG